MNKTDNSEIPEYVELLPGWSVDGEFIGEIFKLDDLSNLHKFHMAPKKENFRGQINKWINQGHFKPSTKEAYDAQNKFIDKKMHPGLYEMSEPKVKYVVPWDWLEPDELTKTFEKIPELEKVELLVSKVNNLY